MIGFFITVILLIFRNQITNRLRKHKAGSSIYYVRQHNENDF